jgi:hypothetical protein
MGETTATAMGHKDTYNTYDPWQAAYLDAMGIPLLECTINEQRRATWIFANDDDAAWMAGMEYRQGDNAVVPAREYKQSFRRMLDVANAMREAGNYEQGRYE